ncbi:thioredoxin family protein [Zooshikella harenae]|uniref:Thioredoxin family protein n=1 Tax=Zooshikella harenae TaxID=2827238 RepID=A0ABS5Z7J8_9GAMM|nr:thioredoxin family protein [Zooshikella harenae]MBU2710021.1 thioredoxin family protein [Zooshikella harenae]
MALTPSSMLPLGTKAPNFNLFNTINQQYLSLNQVKKDAGLLVMFICNHCPYVKHILEGLITLGHDYLDKEIGIVAICSNDAITHPDDSPEKMQQLANKKQFPFPYLHDESQQVARAYHAECTPDFFLFDHNLSCVYRGQFDGARPGNSTPITGQDLRAAMDALLSNTSISSEQKPSIGCNIKWKN